MTGSYSCLALFPGFPYSLLFVSIAGIEGASRTCVAGLCTRCTPRRGTAVRDVLLFLIHLIVIHASIQPSTHHSPGANRQAAPMGTHGEAGSRSHTGSEDAALAHSHSEVAL